MELEQQERAIHLADYLNTLVKHKILIVAVLAVSVLLTAFFTYRMTPLYRASTTLIIEKEQTRSPITGQRMELDGFISQSLSFNTHAQLITSSQILAETAVDLGLDQVDKTRGLSAGTSRGLLTTVRANIRRLFGSEKQDTPDQITPEEKMLRLAAKLRYKIGIQEVRNTLLMRINVVDPDPELARSIAATLADNYIGFNRSSRMESSQDNLGWMTDQLYEIKKNLEDAEREFLEYKENQRLFSIEGKQQQISQKMDDFNSSYLEIRNRRMELDTILATLRRSIRGGEDIFSARAIIDNPVVEGLYNQLLTAELEAKRMAKIYKAKHPQMVQIQTRIENTRRQLREEIGKEFESLAVERSVLVARERVIQQTIDDFESEALDTNRKELQYTILKRNVETNQKLYDVLLAKINESDIVKNRDVPNIRVVEPASLPLRPFKPDKQRNILLSLVFGLVLGIGLAFLAEYMDQSLRTEEDVQDFLGIPVMGVIPKAEAGKGGSGRY